MSTGDVAQIIVKETHGLSWNALQHELSLLEAESLTHLEEEFAHYKEWYPCESANRR